MSINAAQLLQALGSGIVPGGVSKSNSLEGATFDFAALLQKAERGELESGRPVRIDDAAQVDLSPEQIERLNQAADAADVAGARKLFAVIDGLGVVIDVPSRTIEKAVELQNSDADRVLPADVLVGVDAVTIVPGASRTEESGDPVIQLQSARRAAPGGALHQIENQSLLSRLASLFGDPPSASHS